MCHYRNVEIEIGKRNNKNLEQKLNMNSNWSAFQRKNSGEAMDIIHGLFKTELNRAAPTIKMPSLLTLFKGDASLKLFESAQIVPEIKDDGGFNQQNRWKNFVKTKEELNENEITASMLFRNFNKSSIEGSIHSPIIIDDGQQLNLCSPSIRNNIKKIPVVVLRKTDNAEENQNAHNSLSSSNEDQKIESSSTEPHDLINIHEEDKQLGEIDEDVIINKFTWSYKHSWRGQTIRWNWWGC